VTSPKPFAQHLIMAGVAGGTYAAMFFFNGWLFSSFEFTAGVNWIYLPAGMRLLLVLMFGLSGAIGISVGSALISVTVYFAHDPLTGLVAGFISGFAPYAIQKVMQRFAGLESSLYNINSVGLLQLTLMYAVATSFGHQAWYTLRGVTQDFWISTWPMFVGDLIGSLMVLYTAHAVVKLLRWRNAQAY
jgi:hypothetical protein